MTADPVAKPKITLDVKIRGTVRVLEMNSVDDSMEAARALIDSGHGIPKRICKDGVEVCSEADINLHWEKSRAT